MCGDLQRGNQEQEHCYCKSAINTHTQTHTCGISLARADVSLIRVWCIAMADGESLDTPTEGCAPCMHLLHSSVCVDVINNDTSRVCLFFYCECADSTAQWYSIFRLALNSLMFCIISSYAFWSRPCPKSSCINHLRAHGHRYCPIHNRLPRLAFANHVYWCLCSVLFNQSVMRNKKACSSFVIMGFLVDHE